MVIPIPTSPAWSKAAASSASCPTWIRSKVPPITARGTRRRDAGKDLGTSQTLENKAMMMKMVNATKTTV